jgi:hypothetical protein
VASRIAGQQRRDRLVHTQDAADRV